MAMQNGNTTRTLHGHIIIAGFIQCETGIHIGGVSDTIEIGGIDKPIIRNPLDGFPYIPGSSLKGKLRSIIEKFAVKNNKSLIANRHGGDKEKKVWRHECEDFNDAKDCPLCRIFGSTGKFAEKNNYPSMLLVRDCRFANTELLVQDGLPIVEAKMENAIDRLTSAAHPRTFERVPAGAEFNFELIYRTESLNTMIVSNINLDSNRVKEDLNNILTAMDILEKDGLGGNISRGYGKIKFHIREFQGYDTNDNVKGGFKVTDNKDAKLITECKSIMNKIEFTKT